MDKEYFPGQSLLIELEAECFIGTFKQMNRAKTRIEIENVTDFYSGDKIDGTQYFYRPDIKSIKILKEATEALQGASAIVKDTIPEENVIHLSATEIQDIENRSRNSVYIYQINRLYHDAIDHLKKQSQIAISNEGCESGRHLKTKVLTICTAENLYIFDITFLGRIFPELKAILEANMPKKIVHEGRRLADNFKHKQNLEINGVFDTYVAHVAIGGDKKITLLHKCISTYFNLPDNFYVYDKDMDWHRRPLDDDRKIITSKKTILLYKLHDYLLHEIMLRDFYKTCTTYTTFYSHNDDSCEVACDMAYNRNSSADEIEEFTLNVRVTLDDRGLRDYFDFF